MVGLIKSVGKRELMREARIAMRTIDAAWSGEDVADEDLNRMAHAADRIDNRQNVHDENVAAAVEWLKARVENVGLSAMARLVGMDAANLAKVMAGKRKPTASITRRAFAQSGERS